VLFRSAAATPPTTPPTIAPVLLPPVSPLLPAAAAVLLPLQLGEMPAAATCGSSAGQGGSLASLRQSEPPEVSHSPRKAAQAEGSLLQAMTNPANPLRRAAEENLQQHNGWSYTTAHPRLIQGPAARQACLNGKSACGGTHSSGFPGCTNTD